MGSTVRQIIDDAVHRLDSVSDDPYANAQSDVQSLASYVLNCNRAWFIAHADDPFPEEKRESFQAVLEQRVAGVPVAHILGYREFWTVKLQLTPDTLIPRPETEHLVERVLALSLPDSGIRLLDFGTGSGAIAIALASEKSDWEIDALELSLPALEIAKENALQNRVGNISFSHGDSLDHYDGQSFDIIVSNPPYVAEGDPHLTQGDVRFDPIMALTSGIDGLDCIRYLIQSSLLHLKAGGYLLMEHGYDQGEAVRGLLEEAGYTEIQTTRDLSDNERVTEARWPHE